MPKGSSKLTPGDTVQWNTSRGPTIGTLEKKLTKPGKIRRHKVSASPANPEYLVRSKKSGKVAAHKAEALKKLR